MRHFIMIGLLLFAFLIRVEGTGKWGKQDCVVEKIVFPTEGLVCGYQKRSGHEQLFRVMYPLYNVLEIRELTPEEEKKYRR